MKNSAHPGRSILDACRESLTECVKVLICCAIGLHAAFVGSNCSAQEASTVHLRYTPGRLSVAKTVGPLKLAEKNEIPLVLKGAKAQTVGVSFSYYTKDGFNLTPTKNEQTDVRRHQDGSTYVEVTPHKTGKVTITLAANFEDGGMDDIRVDAEVVLPDRKPDRFYVVSFGGFDGVGTIYMNLKGHDMLFPRAVYAGTTGHASISPKDVHFTIVAKNDGDPPISIDELTGRIEPHNIGHALVVTTFAGLKALTCVDVLEDANDGSDRNVCHELVPPGMSDPPTGMEKIEVSGPKVKPRKQE